MVLVQPVIGDSMEFKGIISPTLKELFIEEIETQILSGTLAIGEKLPPEREIAQKMQISRSVVNDGIVEMAKKGFLTIIPRQGTYVADFKKYATADILVSILISSINYTQNFLGGPQGCFFGVSAIYWASISMLPLFILKALRIFF